jgi:hypothetical protein
MDPDALRAKAHEFTRLHVRRKHLPANDRQRLEDLDAELMTIPAAIAFKAALRSPQTFRDALLGRGRFTF